MKNLSVKIDEKIFVETEELINLLSIKRSDYINNALRFYNLHNARLLLKNKLAKESILVRENSLEVLSDMELIED